MFDRNGNDIAPFPIKLPEEATGPLAVFDFTNNRDYRIIIPCAKQLLNYGLDAKPVKGWSFGKASHTLSTGVRWRSFQGKDYLVTADERGNVYVFDRKGATRKKLKNKLRNPVAPFYLLGDVEADLVIASLGQSGYVRKLSLKDKLDSAQPLPAVPVSMAEASNRFLYATSSSLHYRGASATVDIETEAAITAPPALYLSAGKAYLAATTSDNVWVYNHLGELLPGMPAYGTGTPLLCTLDANQPALVVSGDGSMLYCYALKLQPTNP
jgi:hypothetical protein